MNNKLTIEERINKIEERNRRVETDKAWELSVIRKIVVAVLTYSVIVSFFLIAQLPNPFTNSIVPTLGYFISTLSLSFIKNIWIRSKK
jgi:hypothetical protein